MSRKFPLQILVTPVVFGCTVTIAAQVDAPMTGDFNAGSALVRVYGSLEWNAQRLASYQDFGDGHAHVEPAFDATFEEGGATKRIVIATLTPEPKRDYSCHACSPILGGAVFRRDGDSWRRESTGEVIQLSSAWHASLQLMQIGPDRYAVLHQVNDVHGGAETRQALLIFGVGDELSVRFKADGFVGQGTGACALPPQHLIVTTDDEADPTAKYFDLIVDAKWNVATCQSSGQGLEASVTSSGKECRRVTRYRFGEGSYQLLATDVDGCTPLQEQTVSLKG